jgi:adenine-specific DNA methylase
MKYALLLTALLLSACDAGTAQSTVQKSSVLTYQELVNYQVDCSKKEEQLTQLRSIQTAKNFAVDPDELSDNDRTYNSRLKSTIWWYSYRCEQ